MPPPPTTEELKTILETALDAIANNRYGPVSYPPGKPVHMARDITKLTAVSDYEYLDELDYWDITVECLKSALSNPLYCYKRPQEFISTGHTQTEGLELHAFIVSLEDFKRKLYVKFCLKEQQHGIYYLHIDCHP